MAASVQYAQSGGETYPQGLFRLLHNQSVEHQQTGWTRRHRCFAAADCPADHVFQHNPQRPQRR